MGTSLFHGARNDLFETLSSVRSEGGAAVLAHPTRRDSFNKISSELLDLLDGIEIWNRKVDGLSPVSVYFKFARDHGLASIVAMDLHTWRQVFPMWNEMPAGSQPLDGNTIAAALRKRVIAPACILGKLEAGLDRGSSLTLNTLAAAEQFRRLLRNIRDAAGRS
jgi:hypothetical protein